MLDYFGHVPIIQGYFGGGDDFEAIVKCSYFCFGCRGYDMFDYSRENQDGTVVELSLVFLGEKHVCSGSGLPPFSER